MKKILLTLTVIIMVVVNGTSVFADVVSSTGEKLSMIKTTDGYKAFTDSEVKVIDNLNKHTVVVMIRVYTKTGIVSYRGAGIAIDKRHIVTADHVTSSTEKHDNYYRASEGATPYYATVISSDPAHDLSLLEIDKNAPDLIAEPLTFAKEVKENDTVITIGHPRGTMYGITTGYVNYMKGKGYNKIISILVDIRILPGNSGGFAINESGEIVGMMFSSANQIGNIGCMINKDDIINFLSVSGIQFK